MGLMMIKNTVGEYQMFNPKNEDCSICAGFNRLYRTDLFQDDLEIPAAVGKGYCRRITVNPSMKLSINDMTFYEKMTVGGRPEGCLHSLAFCLGGGFLWRVGGNKREYEIVSGESCMYNWNQGISISSYYPGQRFFGIGIELASETMTSLMHHGGKKHIHPGLSGGGSIVCNKKMSRAIHLILGEIMSCRYRDHVKRIYLEGKILELIAVYLDEAIFENEGRHSLLKFSSRDIQALHQARTILDENITSPPTIGKLAKLICLNEYKLKTGFKELFEMPVHAYIIDKRLERARLLMKNERLKVTEAALLVGYNDLSYFAEKFKKKYGVNPSKYK